MGSLILPVYCGIVDKIYVIVWQIFDKLNAKKEIFYYPEIKVGVFLHNNVKIYLAAYFNEYTPIM